MTAIAVVKLTIDGREVEAREDASLLDAALEAGIYVPHLCDHPDLPPAGVCRLCVVEVEGLEGVVSSCVTPVREGMVARTQSEEIVRLRRLAMELLLVGHPPECGTCQKYLNCELQSLKQYLSVEELRLERHPKLLPVDSSNPLFTYDPNKCVLCGRCVRACWDLREVGVLWYDREGGEIRIYTREGGPLAESGCRFCGACAEVCPTGAIQDKEAVMTSENREAALVPCKSTCPAEIDVPRYVRAIKDGDFAAAVAAVRERVPFPAVLGYICDHPCEEVCRRGDVNQPIAIRELKRFAAEHEAGEAWREGLVRKEETGRRVAVVGAGPAGLTAAYYLRLQGHQVTVLEALPAPGGMLRYGVPEYRLPRPVLEDEIRGIEDLGVNIRPNVQVESLEALFEEGHDAVLVAVGAHKGQKLRVPGANSEGVVVGTSFLREVNLGNMVSAGKRVVVLGGGNVAFDCARVAKRLGAEEVTLACLECRADMPAGADEIGQGEDEGVAIAPARTSRRVVSRDGKVAGVEFLKVQSFHFDEDGAPQIEVVEGSEHHIDADTVIFAVGQRPDIPEAFELDRTDWGLVELDELTLSTSREGVFAAGDAVTGMGSAISAMASGRRAAAAVDKFLGGGGRLDRKPAPPFEPARRLGPGGDFAARTRVVEVCAPPEERVTGFCEVVEGLDEDRAVAESSRCLQCDLRLKIKPVKFWGNY
jgi:formate dehydrogenase beta subunit